MDVCGKSLREKNGNAHKGIQNITIRIVTFLKYRDTYRDKNSESLTLLISSILWQSVLLVEETGVPI
jgi:hypothetical protein